MRRLAFAAALLAALAFPPATATAATAADPTAGALFIPSLAGLGPKLHLPHYCSASVVHSTGHDLVLTAAHCVYGTGLGIEFAPGFHDNVSPYGVWSVRRAYLDPAWLHGQDPQHDFALLQLASRGGREIEDVTGAHVLAGAPAAGSSVTMTGYIAGSGGAPVSCTAPAYYTDGYPSLDCAGFAGGVSGGPWVSAGQLVGVIGGLHQGGCSDATSYTAAFGADVAALLARVEAGGRSDFAPVPHGDGC